MSEIFTPIHLIFYLFSIMAIGSAVAVITARNPVKSVLSLVITFFAMAGNWMILHAEFLSLVLLLVYVGAVMTLFLFVVMMLNIETESSHSGFVRYLPFGVVLVLVMVAAIFVSVGPQYFGLQLVPLPAPVSADYSNLTELGRLLFTEFAYPFELAGVLLLAAIIAAITLTHREPRRRKVQNVGDQVSVRPEDRVRLVSMPVETKQGGV